MSKAVSVTLSVYLFLVSSPTRSSKHISQFCKLLLNKHSSSRVNPPSTPPVALSCFHPQNFSSSRPQEPAELRGRSLGGKSMFSFDLFFSLPQLKTHISPPHPVNPPVIRKADSPTCRVSTTEENLGTWWGRWVMRADKIGGQKDVRIL